MKAEKLNPDYDPPVAQVFLTKGELGFLTDLVWAANTWKIQANYQSQVDVDRLAREFSKLRTETGSYTSLRITDFIQITDK
jgi:hypothetical protein